MDVRHPQLIDDLSTGRSLIHALHNDSLNGAQGRLRGQPDDCDLAAVNDLEAVAEWLARKQVAKSPVTVRAYRREAERLFRWCWLQRKKALSDLNDADFSAYRAFLLDPQPKRDWVYPRRVRRSHPNWRIFQGPMSQANAAYTFTILNELFNWLSSKGYLRRNPIAMDSELRKKPEKNHSPTRFALPDSVWDAVVRTIESLPKETSKQIMAYERLRYIFTLAYLMDFRLGDLANNTMGAFEPFSYRGKTHWSWCGIGKGGRIDRVPANTEAMEAVARYRRAIGCESVQPQPGDQVGMVMSISGNKALGADRIYRLVSKTFESTYDSEVAQGDLSPLSSHDLEILKKASTHWLRHTAITRQLEAGIPVQTVQKIARHKDLKTTGEYNTAEFAKIHEQSQKHRLRWIVS